MKLFDQKLLADVDILYVRETVFGVLDGAPLMDHTHPCVVALAAASHWPQHMHLPPHTGCDSTCLQSRLWYVHYNTSHSVVECPAIGCSSCSMRLGAVGASMLSSAVTVAPCARPLR